VALHICALTIDKTNCSGYYQLLNFHTVTLLGPEICHNYDMVPVHHVQETLGGCKVTNCDDIDCWFANICKVSKTTCNRFKAFKLHTSLLNKISQSELTFTKTRIFI